MNSFFKTVVQKLLVLLVLFLLEVKVRVLKKSFVYLNIFIESSEVFATLQSKGPIFCDVTLCRCKPPLHLEDSVD